LPIRGADLDCHRYREPLQFRKTSGVNPAPKGYQQVMAQR
jgi:hypothetical protein